jgi:hypothetical protein
MSDSAFPGLFTSPKALLTKAGQLLKAGKTLL